MQTRSKSMKQKMQRQAIARSIASQPPFDMKTTLALQSDIKVNVND
jgi:hypothetical protein